MMSNKLLTNLLRSNGSVKLNWSRITRLISTSRVNSNQSKETHFGFETVSEEEKASRVHKVFSNVADSYDKMNDLMSGGIHRIWKCQLIKTLEPLRSTQLLDVAGGTGDITFRFLDYMRCAYPGDKSHKVTVCDINENMLEVGQKRADERGYDDSLIDWVQGDAMKLPFSDNSFDAYTIAFGIRNVVDINAALAESYRVLKPGGIFLCLEFSKVRTPILSDLYDWYSFNIIPAMGEVVAGDWKSYQYLVESIRKFPDQKDFADMIHSAGYHMVSYQNLTQGVAAIHIGYKKMDTSKETPQENIDLAKKNQTISVEETQLNSRYTDNYKKE